MNIKKYVESLQLRRGQHKRLDCLCGGKHTLSVSNINGKIKYHCFKASCEYAGIISKELTLEEMKEYIEGPKVLNTPLPLKACIGWDQNIKRYPKAVEYLLKNNCAQAYDYYPNRFFYDTIKDRVVFVEYEGLNSFKVAAGRSLSGQKPKWFKYISIMGEYFVVPYTDTVEKTKKIFIAEDTASACSLSRLGDALALCGTSWATHPLVNTLAMSDPGEVVVCLDADAQEKSAKLKLDLEGFGKFKSIKIANLSNDAKYLSYEQLKKELENV